MSPISSAEVSTLPATCVASKEEQKKAMNPQSVEVVPHSALSARLRWTRFLLQWLQRPLGYTECPDFNPDSPMAGHNASNVTSQQCRGFHPTCHMHCKQMRAKKGNDPQRVERVPHGALSARLRWTRFLLQSLRRPLGYTECPHFNPSCRAQRFKCHQSAAQRFSPYLPHALQANESKKRQ